MPTVATIGLNNFVTLGQRIKQTFGQTLDYTFGSPVEFPIPAGTACMQGFQVSPDEMNLITGYYIKNNTPYPVSYALNDGDQETLGVGAEISVSNPGSGDGENPTTYVMIYTEVFHTLDGTVDCLFFGEP